MLSGQFHYILEIAPAHFQQGSDVEEKVWVAITACQAAGAVRQWSKALNWAEQGLGLQGTSDEAVGLLSLLYGTTQMYQGDPRKAVQCLNTFLDIAQRTPDLSRFIADGFFNLGYANRILNRVEDERHFLAAAATTYAENDRFRQVALTYLDSTWSELHRGEPDLAETTLAKATALLPEYGDSELRIQHDLCLAFLHHLRSRFKDSKEVCERLLTDPSLTPAQEADTSWLLAKYFIQLGDMGMARKWADNAYERALQDWWPLQLTYVQELRSGVIGIDAGR